MTQPNKNHEPVDESMSKVAVHTKSRCSPCSADFDLTPHFLSFMMNNAFFAELGRNLKKVPTRDIPTAMVTFDKHEDGFVMYWNPDFFKSLSENEVQGVIHHELYHIVFGHLAQRKTPAKLWNIAEDMAINSIIMKQAQTDKKISLPGFVCIPGQRACHQNRVLLTDEELKLYPLCEFMERAPAGATSPQYFNTLVAEGFDKKIKDDIEVYIGDVHDDAEIAGEIDSYVKAKMDAILEKAQRSADCGNSWGNIPHELRTAIRDYVNNKVDWRAVLKMFVGYAQQGLKRSSIKKINKRFKYIHPGVQRGKTAKLLIAIDQSGSVDDGMLGDFFDALTDLSSYTTIDILPFDCEANVKDIFTWKKGTKPELKRVRGGGTDFNAPTELVNEPLNQGKWDAMLILTDGEAPAPDHCVIRRGWVYPSNKKLIFDTDETKIVLDKNVGLISDMF